MRSLITATLVISFCFASGWLIGTVDMTGIKTVIVDSYVNRYNTASGSNVDEVIYYVVSENQTALDELASTDKNIRTIKSSSFPRLFNVYLDYSQRRKTLKALRAHESVSAVFTVPFFCH